MGLILEFAKKLSGEVSGVLGLPPRIIAVLLAGLAVALAFVAIRGMHRASIISILVACSLAGTALWVLDRLAARDLVAAGRALDERAFALKLQALAPGSALVCLEPLAPVIQAGCEKALFAGPETAAAAVAYVTAQLEVLAEARKNTQANGLRYSDSILALRGAIERDQFGVVAHVFATRRGCRADHCDLFALLEDTGRVRLNLSERPFEASVALHSPEWAARPNRAGSGVAAFGPSTGNGMGALRPPGKLFFPSASSIPSVNIMMPEAASQTQAETTASADAATRARKPQERGPQSRPSSAVDSSGPPHTGPLQLAPPGQ